MHLYETHVPVADTELAREFYTRVVGLPFASRSDSRRRLSLGGQEKEGNGWSVGTEHRLRPAKRSRSKMPSRVRNLPRSTVRYDKETEPTRHRDVRVWWRQERRAERNRMDAISSDLLSGSRRTHARIYQHFIREIASGFHWDLLPMERLVRGLVAKHTVIDFSSVTIQSMTL